MKLKSFKEKDKKKIGILLFTIVCILLVTGVILYKTFAIFETNDHLDLIKGRIEDSGDIEFAFYIDGTPSKNAPAKESGYSLDTSSSYCMDVLNQKKVSNVSWDDETWEVRIKGVSTTKTKCYLYFKEIYKEEILHGADPDLMDGRLVPVKILDTDKPSNINYDGAEAGKVIKADITDQNTPWYSYQNKQWANAVILKDGETDHYKPNEEIPENVIESYFVWIPRYKYVLKNSEGDFNKYINITDAENIGSITEFYDKHPNQAAMNAFDIVFETKDKGVSSTTQIGQYLTHPAFLSFDCNGFWVGKFETGYNQNTNKDDIVPNNTWNTKGAEHNEENPDKIIIKPNVYSWRSIQVANAFYTSYDYIRELESHMMKNMEWGAIVYLTQSKYGRCTEKDENTTCEEVNINNSEYFITGMSTTQVPTCGNTASNLSCNHYGGPSSLTELETEFIKSYYLKESQSGSSTKNYSGIYDMAGGANEYVMGVMQSKESDATPTSGSDKDNNSGFNGLYSNSEGQKEDGKPWPSSKYYDLYDFSTSNEEYQRGKLGDGTKEFGPFYQVSYMIGNVIKSIRNIGSYNGDSAFFLASEAPWFIRGGRSAFGTEAGIEAFVTSYGNSTTNTSFRIVLTP